MPILGYTVENTKLVVDEQEANRVRRIFEMYLEHHSLLAVVKQLNSLGWRTKRWTTKKGNERGGRPFNKNSLYKLLTNVAYIGKVRYKEEIHEGEHEAIVDAGVFERVQAILRRNGRSGGRGVRNKYGALLRGILRCAACDCGMAHAYTRKGNRLYRYYVCTNAQRRGWRTCPSPSVPAGEIEQFVVKQIKCIGRDPALVAATLAHMRRRAEEGTERLERERAALQRQRGRDEAELRRLACSPGSGGDRFARLADVQERLRLAERRLTEINEELAALSGKLLGEQQVADALADFDGVWAALAPREQARVLELLIERIEYDGRRGNLSITFRPNGIKSLAEEPGSIEEAIICQKS